MRILLLLAILLASPLAPAPPTEASASDTSDVAAFYTAADALLGAYVDDQGRVDYAGVRANRAAVLDPVLAQIAALRPSQMGPNDAQAVLINAYNVLVINAVLQNWPMDNPKDVAGFFDEQTVTAFSAPMTLDDVENRLFQSYPDPRHHFVLVCAAQSCPTLPPRAFRGSTLDAQLDTATRATLNNPKHVAINTDTQTIRLTRLFKWYKADFTGDKWTVRHYVNRYRNTPLPTGYTIDHLPYNWSLNRQP